MLARLWKNSEARPLLSPAPLDHGPALRPSPAALHCVPQPRPSSAGPKLRRKPIEIEDIYPEKKVQPEGLTHALALLDLLKTECTWGKYIKRKHLERMYQELCVREGWTPRHWMAIAPNLGKLTEKRTRKEKGKRFVAYRVPKS